MKKDLKVTAVIKQNEEEFEEYIEISKKLLKFFDFENGTFKKDEPLVERLLLKRKNIIHKATNKIAEFKKIFSRPIFFDLLSFFVITFRVSRNVPQKVFPLGYK